MQEKADQKRAEWLKIIKGELFFKKELKAESHIIITDPKEQKYILEACMSLLCYFRAFGITKTCKVLTERFY